jgi:hypothetical protein
MDRLFSHFVSNVMGYMAYTDETAYLRRLGCKHPTNELCKLLREYQTQIAPAPRLHDFIRYHAKICEPTCRFYVPFDMAISVIEYAVCELGYFCQCEKLYNIYMFYVTEGRYPTEMEMMLLQADIHLSRTTDELRRVNVEFDHQFHQFQNQFQRGQRVQREQSGQREQRGQREQQREPVSYTDKYPPYVLQKSLDADCCMCQDPLLESQRVMTLPCMHTFHCHVKESECVGIEKWLATNPTCPLCKYQV